MRLRIASFSIAIACLLALGAGSAQAISVRSQTFQLSGSDAKDRLEAHCAGKKKVPYSGGMITDGVGADGEGIYPHSYERLGVQRGWHVTPVLFAPSAARAASTRSATLQVVCGPRLGAVSSPHTTVFVGPGETRTAFATCPRGTRLLAGGFQRTNFVSRGGNFITESRAASGRAWLVSGSAFGNFGGELTAIAYCIRSARQLVSEVSSVSPLPRGEQATATTPPCPRGSRLVSGGFSTSPSGSSLVASAYFNPNGSWSSTAFNRFGPSATLTANGYCMRASLIRRMSRRRHHMTRAPHEKVIKAPGLLDAALKVAISERVSNNGCFPNPGTLAATLRANGIRANAARNLRSVRRSRVVHVLSDHASCGRVRLAMRSHGGVVVLDSATGEVRRHRAH
jgi:hypothetical protein